MENNELVELSQKINDVLDKKQLTINEKFDVAFLLYEQYKIEKQDFLEGNEYDDESEMFDDFSEVKKDPDEEVIEEKEEEDFPEETSEEQEELDKEMEIELGSEIQTEPEKVPRARMKKSVLVKQPKVVIKR